MSETKRTFGDLDTELKAKLRSESKNDIPDSTPIIERSDEEGAAEMVDSIIQTLDQETALNLVWHFLRFLTMPTPCPTPDAGGTHEARLVLLTRTVARIREDQAMVATEVSTEPK